RSRQRQPGSERRMKPRPRQPHEYKAAGKLKGKVALITGGDSGIGRAVALVYAKEGADVCIAYLSEHDDAQETRSLIEAEGRRCLAIAGDVGTESHCRHLVEATVQKLGRLDVLVNNAGEQHVDKALEELDSQQLET